MSIPRDRINLRTACIAGLLLVLATTSCLAGAVPIAPGVTAEEIREEEGPWEIRVIRVARAEEQVEIVAALARGRLSGVEPISGMIARESTEATRVVAAVNADFFRMGHRPFPGGVSGVCVRDGELITTPRGRAGFYLSADGSPRIVAAQSVGEVRVGGRSFPLGGMNMPDQGAEGSVQIFTEIGGWEPDGGAVVAAVEEGPLRSHGSWQGVVTDVVTPGRARAAELGEVLIATLDPAVLAILQQARAGEPVQIAIRTEPFSEPVLQAVGGNPVLVREGTVVADDSVRHPRTAIGFNDEEIIIVTVDGRQPGWSVGMSMLELAQLMQRLGCTEAMNLDGGGSTTAWVRDGVVNRPSDGIERSIANALLVVSSAPRGEAAAMLVLPRSAVLMPGAELPLSLEVTDQWHNPVGVDPESIRAEVFEQEGPGEISVQLHESRLSVSGGPGNAIIRLWSDDAPGVAGLLEIAVVQQPATLELHPPRLRLMPQGAGDFEVRASDADGARLVVPAEEVRWELHGDGFQHLGEGRFEAAAEGARAEVSVSLGGVEARGLLVSSTEVVVEDFSGDTAPGFRGIPDSVSAQMSLRTEEHGGREMSFCRMEYDLGAATVTRAAYMIVNRELGHALSVSLLARAEARPAWVRMMVTDATGASHLLTLTGTLAPDQQWRRLHLRLPPETPGPLVLRSVYVVATAGDEARGVLEVSDIRAQVVGEG